MRYFLISLSFCFFLVTGYSAEVTITATHDGYAGKSLSVYKYYDLITETKDILSTDVADSTGAFQFHFDINSTQQVFFDIGVYQAYLFVEPGKNYHILLPEFKEKTKADELNPFFEPIALHLAMEKMDDKDLNMQIRMFEDIYLPYLNKHIQHVLAETDFSTLDADVKEIEKNFRKSENTFFNDYRKYRYGFLRYLAQQRRSKNVSDDLFTNSPVLYNNPAYWELFLNIYEEYFDHLARTPKGKRIGRDISVYQNIDSLRQTLKADGNLQSDDLIDLIILKGLHKEFYDDNYSRSALLKVLETLIANPSNEENKAIAQTMYNKVTKLLVGFAPPAFELYDLDSNLVTLDDFRGKHVYLNFCSCFSYTCLSEFAQLNILYQKHRQYLEIVTILVDEDIEKAKDLIERSGYRWKFLHYGNQVNIINEYDIRAYPTYYLIDREGKLIMSPAPTPNDQFEGRLFMVLRADGVL